MKNLKLFSVLFVLITLISSCSVNEKNQKTNKTETKPIVQEKPKEMTKVKFEVSVNNKIDTIIVELYNETPLHRDNFIKLVNEKYYDGVLFHRVIKDFMIQGGDPDSKTAKPNQQLGNGGPNYTIPAEINVNLIHKKGALAAARLGDNVNPQKASSGSQFYIVHGRTFSAQDLQDFSQRTGHYWSADQISTYENIGGAPHLDGAYTVFGEVIQGLEIVDLIANQPTNTGDRPKKDIKIISATIVK
jgi:cyclophilin family peptidyl-prolyl cis-trans isomerase